MANSSCRRAMPGVPPAMLAHAAAILRLFADRPEFGFSAELNMPHPRLAELVIVKDDLRFVFAADLCGRRWIGRAPHGVRGEEELDLAGGLAEALRLLNSNVPGEPGTSAVHGPARAGRSNAVETRRASVIRV